MKLLNFGNVVMASCQKLGIKLNDNFNQTIDKTDKTKCSNHGEVETIESNVIERRQQQLGRMADFPPPVTFSVFEL